MYNGRLKQSRAVSAVGFFAGILFVGIGLFVMIPIFGMFGIIWTLIATVIGAVHGYGFFSKRGVVLYEAEIGGGLASQKTLSGKLQEIEEARREGHISESEYLDLRKRALSE